MSVKAPNIPLGFEVGSGQPVSIPLKHLCITGQTQESGKTTTLEALITRSGLRAIAFITKRGEGGFDSGSSMLPFFEERADWEFVESVMEATMHEKKKFERSWTIKACRGAHTLADVQRNAVVLGDRSKRSMDQDLYMLLNEYLSKVVPLIAGLPKSPTLALKPGLNVMDLCAYPEELQSLVISSTIRWIHRHERDVITIIPEAWKFCPQGRKTPVYMEVRKLAREGAGLKNYIWIDSQDLAGVEKEILRACAVWLLGVQREANEIERALANIPKSIKRPKEEQIATLKLGQFYACWGEHVHLTYVQPAWLPEYAALDIAKGVPGAELHIDDHKPQPRSGKVDYETLYRAEKVEREKLEGQIRDLNTQLLALRGNTQLQSQQPIMPVKTVVLDDPVDQPLPQDFEKFYELLKKRLIADIQYETGNGTAGLSALATIAHTVPELEVVVKREKITVDTTTTRGRVLFLIARGFFDVNRISAQVSEELGEQGLPTRSQDVGNSMRELAEAGFLIAKDKGRYVAVQGMKRNIIEA